LVNNEDKIKKPQAEKKKISRIIARVAKIKFDVEFNLNQD
jgi:hypothetical protein